MGGLPAQLSRRRRADGVRGVFPGSNALSSGMRRRGVAARLERLGRHLCASGSAAASPELDNVSLEMAGGGVAVLSLDRPPVNSFSAALGRDLVAALEQCASDDAVKACVIRSANPKVWSGGLDLSVVFEPDKAEFMELWSAFEAATLAVYTFPKPTVVALAGNSPAAGAVLSLHADYRLAAEGTQVGFNEAQLDLALPDWLMTTAERVVGAKNAERMLQQGMMMSAAEAAEIGLVDAIADDHEAVTAAALAKAAQLGKIWRAPSTNESALNL